MKTAFGALSINANTTASIAPNTAAKHTQGWAAHGVTDDGDVSVTPSAANSRLTLNQPGFYKIDVSLVVETEDISGTSGDDAGVVTFQLYKGGSAVAGALGKSDSQDSDRPQTVSFHDIVQVTQAQIDAATNYVEIYVSSGDASGNDITVSDARFTATRLD